MRMGISGLPRHPKRLAEAALGFGDVELLVRGHSDEAVPVHQAEWPAALLVVAVCPVLPPADSVEIEAVELEERRDVCRGGNHPGRHGIRSRETFGHQL